MWLAREAVMHDTDAVMYDGCVLDTRHACLTYAMRDKVSGNIDTRLGYV